MQKKARFAIFASGSGSNAEAIIKWAKESTLAEVVCVICNKRGAKVHERARNHQIESLYLPKTSLMTKTEYENGLLLKLKERGVDWVCLAGYMIILSPHFLTHFPKRVINIHPSLLPFFPGKDGYGDAFRARVEKSGCTIHFVDEGIDTGTIIAQKEIPLYPEDTLEQFKERGLAIENAFYPEVLEQLFAKNNEDT